MRPHCEPHASSQPVNIRNALALIYIRPDRDSLERPVFHIGVRADEAKILLLWIAESETQRTARGKSHHVFVGLNLFFVWWSLQVPRDTKSRYNVACGTCLAKTPDDRVGLLVVHPVLDGACLPGGRGR